MAIIDRTELLTAEQYAVIAGGIESPTELVRGQIVVMNVPSSQHGQLCGRIATKLAVFLDQHPLGQFLTNDSGIITGRGPDTVRGADIAYYSYQRLPAGLLPKGYVKTAPELVFEVLSPSDRESEVQAKIAEYLQAGVLRVCVVDADRELVTVFSGQTREVQLTRDQTLTLPEVLPGFSVPVAQLFA